MILQLKNTISNELANQLAVENQAFCIRMDGQTLLITGSNVKEVPTNIEHHVDKYWVFANDIQLASKSFNANKRKISLPNVEFGGNTHNTVLIGGPCSVESEDQIRSSAELLVGLGLTTLRGGCYKPRTSPYSFQGMGLDGLKLLAKMRQEFGLNVITEARDATHIDEIIEYTDVIQVGAKAMYTNLPIILDPSHAMGYAYGVPVLARACVAMGIDGLLIETHPNPKIAKSDASQQLDYSQFEQLLNSLRPVAESVGYKMV